VAFKPRAVPRSSDEEKDNNSACAMKSGTDDMIYCELQYCCIALKSIKGPTARGGKETGQCRTIDKKCEELNLYRERGSQV
jgi:hypothetical protein